MRQIIRKINFSTKVISLDKMENKLSRSRSISENISFESMSSSLQDSSEPKPQKNVIIQRGTVGRLKIPISKNSDDKLFRRKKRARGLTNFIQKRNSGFRVNKLPNKNEL
ncbi:unnamed protein product [Moneuplotes crassus]|uniref:Uncharacterized protein n=1 Tax=Euplotes crassus TaxID=5936 RepID=A0AAD1U5I4_EUPCR|nr:unnamed protein product [Moneuplotes crassus]